MATGIRLAAHHQVEQTGDAACVIDDSPERAVREKPCWGTACYAYPVEDVRNRIPGIHGLDGAPDPNPLPEDFQPLVLELGAEVLRACENDLEEFGVRCLLAAQLDEMVQRIRT